MGYKLSSRHPASLALPVRLPQDALEDLACGVAGEHVGKTNGAGPLEAAQLSSAEFHYLFLGSRCPLAQDYYGLHSFAPLGVRHPYDRSVADGRMFEQDILNYTGVNVSPPDTIMSLTRSCI